MSDVGPLCPFKFCNHLTEEERTGCFTFFSCFHVHVFVCVLMSLPQGAMGWFVICDNGISWPYPLLLMPNFHLGIHVYIIRFTVAESSLMLCYKLLSVIVKPTVYLPK